MYRIYIVGLSIHLSTSIIYFYSFFRGHQAHFKQSIIYILIPHNSQMEPQQDNHELKKDNYEADSEEEEKRNLQSLETPLEKFKYNAPKKTLDEGYCQSLGYQLKGICIKFSYVLIPRSIDKSNQWIKDWDLWGPFLLCLAFVFFIDQSDNFIVLLTSIGVGAAVVAFNTRILGGKISFWQTVSVLGYCLLPLLIVIAIWKLLHFLRIRETIIKMILITIGVIWSIFGARSFISVNIAKGKKFVALFPIILFYVFLGLILAFG